MAPKHKNPTSKNRTAVAPYNFVPVPERPITFPDGDPRNPLDVDQGKYHEGRWTGWINVKLTTKSPLYIRGVLKPDEFEQKERQEADTKDTTPHLDKIRNRPDFFHTGDADKPVIPGSSLRGMIRQIVEILGHGKLKPVMNSPLVYRAVGDTSSHGEAYRKMLMAEDPTREHYYTPLFKGGYVRKDSKGNWFIQPAQEIKGTTYGRVNQKRIPQQLSRWHNCHNASEIYVEIGDYDYKSVRGSFLHVKQAGIVNASSQSQPGMVQAVLARSGRMFSKKTEAVIFPPDDNADWISIPDGSDENDPRDLVTEYRDQVSPEQEKLLGKGGALRDYQPVFYLLKNGKLLFFFGHTQMFRMPYPRSPKEMLHPVHSDDTRIDFAEAMFGKVRGSGTGGYAGRVFVTDACLDEAQKQDKLWLEDSPVIIPKVLSNPKPTTFQHYLTQSSPNVDKGKELHTYNSSPGQTTLRGYKMYWHKGKTVKCSDFTEKEIDVGSVIRTNSHAKSPVREDVAFTFRVHFENLLPAELGLLW
ncbi:MAG: TIGR03986 family CRISPR-associated RAMP protein [Chloroflexota bacterium]